MKKERERENDKENDEWSILQIFPTCLQWPGWGWAKAKSQEFGLDLSRGWQESISCTFQILCYQEAGVRSLSWPLNTDTLVWDAGVSTARPNAHSTTYVFQ